MLAVAGDAGNLSIERAHHETAAARALLTNRRNHHLLGRGPPLDILGRRADFRRELSFGNDGRSGGSA
jgi:hypothetical protein